MFPAPCRGELQLGWDSGGSAALHHQPTVPSQTLRLRLRNCLAKVRNDVGGETNCGIAFGFMSRSKKLLRRHRSLFQTSTVTCKKVAGIDVPSLSWLLFWALNNSSNSRCKSAARPFLSAASNAFMVGP